MKIITSWDDGSVLDLKVAKLLLKYKLPGIFYIVVNNVGLPDFLSWDDIKWLDKNGFEIGSHTMTHPSDLKMVYDEDLKYEILSSKELLDSALGHPVKSFCYPRGRYDERVMRQVAEAGYLEARTTIVGKIKPPEDKLETHTSVHVYPNRKEYNGKDWVEFAEMMYRGAKEFEDTVFHLWGHSWEVEKYQQWEKLEEFLKMIYEDSTAN